MAGVLDGQLWFIAQGGPSDADTGHVNSDGSNVTQAGTQLGTDQSQTVGIDLAAGLYFTINSGTLTLQTRSISNPSVVLSSVQIGNDLNTPSHGDDDVVNALAVDPYTHTIYVGLWGQDKAHTGIVQVSYNTSTGALDPNAAYGTVGVYDANTPYLISNQANFTDARDFAIDHNGGFLYYTDDDNQYSIAPFSPTNGIYRVSLSGGAPVEITSNANVAGGFPTNQSNGIIGPMALDKTKGLIYFETNHIGDSHATLWYVSSSASGAVATQVSLAALPAGVTLSFGDVPQGGISIDEQNQYIFITVQSGTGTETDPDQILQGVLSADGHSVTSWINPNTLATLDGHTPNANSHIADTAFDQLPTLTVTGTATHAPEQGANPAGFIDLTSAATTITDTDGNHLASATVQITGGTFTANETSANDDHLTVNDGGTFKSSGTFTSTNITISYDSASETLTLTGYDTLTNYQTVLNAVTFNTTGDNPTDYGLNNTRTIHWTASDGAQNIPFGSQNSQSTTITIDAQNDAPNVNVAGGNSASINVNETNSGLNQSASLTITDPDSLTETLTLTTFSTSGPTNGIPVGTLQGYFSIPASANIVQNSGSASFNWTFNSSSEAFNYLPAGVTLTLNYNIHDVDSNNSNGPGSASLSDDQAISVVITGTNDAPVVTAGNATPYTENDPATTISPSATITDVDSADFNTGSLTIGFTANGTAADQLTIQNQGAGAGEIGVSGSNVTFGGVTIGTFAGGTNGTNLVITFNSASATPAAAQALLDHIQYANNSDNPSTLARTVTYTLNDGDGTANGGTNTGTATATINVTAVNDPPVNNKPGAQVVNEDATLTFNSGNGNLISITDPDVQGGNETVTLSVNHGILTLGSTVGITFDNSTVNGTASFKFHGTLASVNTALNGLQYKSATDFNGSDTLTITTNDGGNTGQDPGTSGGPSDEQDQDTVGITVTAINDAPTVVNGTSVSLIATDEDTASAAVSINSLLSTHFSDAADNQIPNGGASAPNNFAGIAVIQNNAGGTQGAWEYSTDGGSNWTPFPAGITSTTALLIAATDLVHFVPAADFNGTPGGLIVNLVDDSSGAITTGNQADLTTTGGTSRYSSTSITIGESVNSVNDAPVLTGLPDGIPPFPSFTESGASVALDSDASVNDTELDALNSGNGNYAGASLTLVRDSGANANDVFTFSGGTFTVVGNELRVGANQFATFTNSGGTLAISFTSSGTVATTALVNDVLDHINYANSSDAPPAQVQIDYTLNDGNAGSQGSGGALTATGNVTVNITPTNDAPDVTPNSPAAVTYVLTQASPLGLLSTGAVTDPDQPASFVGGDLTIAITAGADVGNDHLNLLGSSPFTVVSNQIKDGSTIIGDVAGYGTESVSITNLTAAATPTEISKLLEAFGFSTTSTDTSDRSVTFTFHDGGNVGDTAPGASDAVTQTVHVVQPATGQLYFRINNGPDDQVGHINADGSSRATLYTTTTNETSIAIDTAAGLVFTAGSSDGVHFDAVLVHNLHTGALIGSPFVVGATTDVVQSLALDLTTHTLYVSDKGSDTDHTGIKTLSYDAGGTLTNNGFLFTATDTETTATDATTAQFTNAQALYYDYANHLLYYVDDNAGNSAAASNGVYVFDTTTAVDTTGPAFNPVQLTDPTQFPAAATPGGVGTAGNIVGLAVDVADGFIFFETTDVANSANNALWWITTSGGAGQTATKITLPGGVSLNHAGDTSAGGDAAGLTFDPATSQLYLTNAYYSVGPNLGAIYALQWDNTGHTVSLVHTFDTATLVGAAPSASDAPSVTAFDDAPTLAVTSATPTFTESATNPASANNTPVTLLNSATVGDPDGAGNLAGATVSISSGFLTGDVLSATVSGTNITPNYVGGVLTLTGTDTFAHYQTVLNSVQYTSTSENPTNYGVDNARTITWSVTDGVLTNPTPLTTSVIVAGADDAPINTVPATQPIVVNEDTALAFTGGNTISVADPDNQSLSVTVSVLHGAVTLGSTTNLTTVALNGTDSVLFSGAIADINNALATLTYQGDPNFHGADTLTISTDDGIAPTTDSTVAITVDPVDDAPSGSDNSVSTPVSTDYVFSSGAFPFSDAADNPANTFTKVKITGITLPAGATLKLDGVTVNNGDEILVSDIDANKLVFHPVTGAGGANYAHFTFQVEDNGSNTPPNANIDPTPNLLTINVGSGFGPTAAADNYQVLENNEVDGTAGTGGTGVLHNDSGSSISVTAVNGDGLKVGVPTAGTYGHLTLNSTGDFAYLADQTGAIDGVGSATHPVDTFNYTITDGASLSATTTVSFSIDRPPTSTTHSVGLIENGSTGTVSANDTDPDGDSLTVTALTGGTVGTPLAGTYGSLTVNTNDTYSYSANNIAAIDGAAIGSHPIDTFTYTVSDGLGGTANETFNFSVDRSPSAVADNDATNDAAGPVNGAITEGAAAGTTVGITALATDPDGDTITYSLTNSAGGFFKIDASSGVVSVDTNGATGINFESAATYSITVKADDGHGLNTTQSFTIAVNDAPPSAPADSDTGTADAVTEGASANTYVGLTASSTDPNGGTIVYSLTDDAGGAFKILSNGQVEVNNPAAIDYESATGHALSITVQAATTGGSIVSTHDFSIAITNANPSLPTDADGTANSVTEGAASGTLVNITASSTDPNGPPMIYSITSDGSNGGFKIDSSSGVVSVDDATKINYETAPGHAYSITVQASDGAGGTSAQSFSIAVGDVAPSATADTYNGANAANEDQALNIAAAAGVLANDTDVNGGPLTAVLNVGPAHAASFTLNPDGSFNYTPSANFSGSDSFTYHAFDGSQSSGVVSATITVNPINDAPVLSGLGDAGDIPSFIENGSSVLLDTNHNSAVSDIELDASATHYEGASLTIQRSGGPNADDAFAATGSLDLVDVNGNGDNVSLDGGVTFIGKFVDNDDGSIQFTFNSSAAAGDIAQVMRQIVYGNTSDNPPATVPIDFIFSDGNGVPGGQGQGGGPTPGIATSTVTVNVTQVDDPPALLNVAVAATYSIGSAGATLSPSLQAFDPDAVAPSPNIGLASATITITAGFLATDQLFVNLPTSGGHFLTDDDNDPNTAPVVTNISVTSNAGGQLVLGGTDSVLHYQEVLDAVSYSSSAADPTNGGADQTRTINWKISDGILDNQAPTLPLYPETTLGFNSPPSVDLDGSTAGNNYVTTFTENGAPIAITNANVSVTDTDDAAISSATVVLTNAKAGDALSIAGALPGGIGSSIDTSVAGQITLQLFDSATLADYQTALGQIRFVNSSEAPNTTDRDITVQVVNSGTSNVAHATVHVVAVNDAPVNAVPGAQSVNEDTNLAITGLAVSDVDGGAGALTTTLSVAHGVLTVASAGGAGISGSGTNSVTLTGTLAQINTTLSASGNVVYKGAANFNGADTLNVVTNDGGNTGTGGAKSDTDTVGITVNAVNDAPAFANFGAAHASATEQTFVRPNPGATVSDVDLDAFNAGAGNYAGASLIIGRTVAANPEDTFFFGGPGITFTVDTVNHVLLAGGQQFATYSIPSSGSQAGTISVNFNSLNTIATTALVNNVLQHIVYENLSDTPPASVTMHYTFNDGNFGGLQGSGGNLSDTANRIVDITAVNDPPVITSDGGGDTATVSVIERTTAVTTVVAPDPDGPSVTYSIVGGADAAKFQIDAATGALSFVAAPNFDIPTDTDHNNSYLVNVRASDGSLSDDQAFTVQVTDNPAVTSTVHWVQSVDTAPHPAGWVPQGNGDFNGDGTTDLAWYNASTNNIDIWTLSNGTWAASSNVGSHPAGYQPVGFGDYNGDHTSDVLWYNPTTRDVDLWNISNGQWAGSVDIGTHPAGSQPVLSGDFNGDGTSDIAWYNPTTNGIDIWKIGTNGQWIGSVDVGSHPAGYIPALAGDFNGDGTSDIAWFNPTTGDVDIWKLSDGHWAGSADVGPHPAGWQPLGAADFSLDGTSDISWYNPTTNDIEIWLIKNGQWAGSSDIGTHPGSAPGASAFTPEGRFLGAPLPPAAQPVVAVGVGDFDHSGVADIMWQDKGTGHLDNWMLAYS